MTELEKLAEKCATLDAETLNSNIVAELKVLNAHNIAAVECRDRLKVMRNAYHAMIVSAAKVSCVHPIDFVTRKNIDGIPCYYCAKCKAVVKTLTEFQ